MTRGGPARRFLARRLRLVTYMVLAAGIILAGPQAAGAQDDPDHPRVLTTEIDGTITPVIADHIIDVVSQAERDDYDALVVHIDTPGGLDTSMRQIIQRFLSAEVPVIAYVSPEGARAASAGSMITMAAHVAAMAPGTAIGAATPVQLGGDEPSDSEQKAINDAAALAEALAERRDRDVEFAVDTVREGRSASASEALQLNAIDAVSPSLTDLLDEVDGWTVELAGEREVTLTTADAVIDTADMGIFRQIQQFLADPNLAFLFLSVGTLGLIYELANPGVGGAGVVGAIFIILALFGIAVLPVNVVGLLFLLIAVALFVAELFAPGIGVAAAGGAGALVLSGIFLFRGTPGMEVSLWVVGPVALVMGVAVIVAGQLVMRTRGVESTTTGTGLFVGREIDVTHVEGDRGRAFVEGALWTVRSAQPPLTVGAARVVAMDGLTLVVEQQSSDEQDAEETPDANR